MVFADLGNHTRMVSEKGGKSMRTWIRLLRAERYKMKHTILPVMHVGIPLTGSILLLIYYRATSLNGIEQVSGFIEIVGMGFPFLVSLICSRSMMLEEGNHYQTFLGGSAARTTSLSAKCIVLQLLGLLAVILGIGSFALGEQYLLGNADFPVMVYPAAALALWLGSLIQYPIHLFLNMRFSQSVSMGIGVAQSVLAALLVTGLGEGIWQFIPCSWSIRMSIEQLKRMMIPGAGFSKREGIICLLISVVVCVIIFVWFHYKGENASAASMSE